MARYSLSETDRRILLYTGFPGKQLSVRLPSLFESLLLPQKSFAMQDLFARNGSGFLGTASCAQITSRNICGEPTPFCRRRRENVMRFPTTP